MQTKKGIKSLFCLLCAVLLCLALTGCWDYRGLDEVSIVAGLAIDRSEENPDQYLVSFEIIDVGAFTEGEEKSQLVESEGDTVFDAVNKARGRLVREPYFGNVQLLVISEEIARNEGVGQIVEGFFREAESRENIDVVISQEETAKALITPGETSTTICSYEIKKNIGALKKTTASAPNLQIYQIYDIMMHESNGFVLPAFRGSRSDDKTEPGTSGLAAMWDQRLIGFIDEEDVPYYLFAMGEITGGGISFSLDGSEREDVSVNITKSEPRKSVRFDGQTVQITVDIAVTASLVEMGNTLNPGDPAVPGQISKKSEEVIAARVSDMFSHVQERIAADVFGFGINIEKTDPALWARLREDWMRYFRDAVFHVNVQVKMADTGFVKG